MNIFAHVVLVGENRHLRMSDVLSLTLGPFPWALVNGDVTLRKMNKAALARPTQVLPAETIPEPSVTITDGISLVQKMKGNDQTFSQHACSSLTPILHAGVRSHSFDVVFATYREDLVKNAGISNRNIFQIKVPCHRIQQWRKFLSSSANKASLMRFLVVECRTRKPRDKLNDKQQLCHK